MGKESVLKQDGLRQLENDSIYNNDEPVFYCKDCLSLNIRVLNSRDYCDVCGCTDIDIINILEWEEKYKVKYNKLF